MIRLALCAHVCLISLTARVTLTWSLLAPPKQYKSCEGVFVSLCAVTLFCISLFSFLVFLRYQIYYDYPLETYLEYPIIIAQGNFCKPCFGNETGLIQHSKALHVGTVLHCSDAGVGGKME